MHTFQDLEEQLIGNPLDEGLVLKHPLNAELSKSIRFNSGELTVFSGQTGSGKTSVTVQMAIDFWSQGLEAAYFSQEIDPALLLTKYIKPQLIHMSQASQKFTKQVQESMHVHQGSEALTNSDDIQCWRSEFEEFIDQYKYKIIFVDNLQIILYNKEHLQTELLYQLLEIAKTKRLHIVCVCHPNKMKTDKVPITLGNIFGEGSATQLAANVLALQKVSVGIDKGLFVYEKENCDDRHQTTPDDIKLPPTTSTITRSWEFTKAKV